MCWVTPVPSGAFGSSVSIYIFHVMGVTSYHSKYIHVSVRNIALWTEPKLKRNWANATETEGNNWRFWSQSICITFVIYFHLEHTIIVFPTQNDVLIDLILNDIFGTNAILQSRFITNWVSFQLLASVYREWRCVGGYNRMWLLQYHLYSVS